MRAMRMLLGRYRAWILAWLVVATLGSTLLARRELAKLRDTFDTDARIAHRLLSQRAVQHEAILATLTLLQPSFGERAEQRLPALYPQILTVQRRDGDAAWPDARMQAAELQSRQRGGPVLAEADLPRGRYLLVLAGQPASFALAIDLDKTVPWSEWPMAKDHPARLVLQSEGREFVVQAGRSPGAIGWRFEARKVLAAGSQPFDLVAQRDVGWRELPWSLMLAWSLAAAALLAGLWSLQRQRAQRLRAEELLRIGQVSRLNALGELAAGMAHELNQPLTAVLANTQAASRLLADDPPDLSTARDAMTQAAQQARRAADVLGRLRRTVERPSVEAAGHWVDLHEAVRNAFYLLEPEFTQREVTPELQPQTAHLAVRAEPVALAQIIHNLLMNSLQALETVSALQRKLVVRLSTDGADGVLSVEDSGPGIAPDILPRIFEPFFSTREHGLGLGLSLCESLAAGMGGRLEAGAGTLGGAVFRLRLPLVSTP
jgi:signal transduction histidine kinase